MTDILLTKIGDNSIKISFNQNQDDIKEIQSSKNSPVMTKKTLVMAGVLSCVLFISSNGVDQRSVSASSSYNQVFTTSTIDNSRSGLVRGSIIKNAGSRRDYSSIENIGQVESLVSGEPGNQQMHVIKYILPSTELKDSHLEINANMTIHVQSAYVKMGTASMDENKKGGVVVTSFVPTFLRLYIEDISSSLKNQPLKISIASILVVITSWLGLDFIKLVSGLFFIAIIDCVLGLIPGNAKPGTEGDQRIQAKVLGFITNSLVLLGAVQIAKYLQEFTDDKGFMGVVSNYFHYAIACWIFSIYLWRFVGYVSRANKAKIPKTIKKLFDNDAS